MQKCNPCGTPIDNESKLGAEDDPTSDPMFVFTCMIYVNHIWLLIMAFSFMCRLDLSTPCTNADWVTLSRSSTEVEYKGVVNVVAKTAWRTKHNEFQIHFVRDFVASGQVCVLHVPSRFQYVDIFTKGLSSALFLKFPA
ncbi:ribonuclease H-like domain-containing protein [Tanacetum coccineum]